MLLNTAVLLLLTLSSMAYALPTFNVMRYGAAGNGQMLDSPAIQRAIDAASIHGGTVIVPAGTYLSGSIFVKSGVTLEIQDITLHDFTLENVTVAMRINMNWNPSYSYATIPPGITH